MSQSPIRIIIRVRAQGTGKAAYNSTRYAGVLAERGGFEPPIRLPVCRISSAVHSTTLPPLRVSRSAVEAGWISWGSGIHKRPSAPAARQVAPGPRRGEVKGAGGRFRLTDQGSVRMSSTLRAGHLVPRFPFAAARPPRIEAGTAKKPARRGLPAESRV